MAAKGPTPSGSGGKLRRSRRQHLELDALDLYARIAQGTPGSIANEQRIEGAIGRLRERLIDVAGRRSTLRGWQAQALFEAIVVTLGNVQLLKLEDAGDYYYEVVPPRGGILR